jgi:hypothetical protein
MTKMKRYISFALVAALAASAGWGASALSLQSKSNLTSAPQEAAQMKIVPASLQPEMLTASSSAAPVAASAGRSTPVAQPAVSAESVPVTRTTARRAREVNPRVVDETPEAARGESDEIDRAPAPIERKKGMSNKTKTVIAIGGGAATGAIIGGIAGGGKGAAIGAAIGGGSGAIYSVIRNKQNKPVW